MEPTTTITAAYPVRAAEDMSTPELVREYAAVHMEIARGDRVTNERHETLCAVVDELRLRGVLDLR